MKQLEIKKIPVDMLLDTLTELYNSGVRYVNMIVEKGPQQDSIWIVEDAKKEEVKTNIDFEELG